MRILVEPKLICRDIDASTDMHYILAYRFNPKLTEISRKYVSIAPRTVLPRRVVTWINEYDGAHILVVYENMWKSFEELVVEWLYNLRDYYVEHKIDLNTLKNYLAHLSAVVAHQKPEMFKDISELLNILGCNIELRVKTRVEEHGISEEELAEMLKNLSVVFGAKPNETVRATIRVLKNGKPYKNARIEATIIYPSEEKVRKQSIMLTADEQGIVAMPVPKFSALRLSVDGYTEEVVIANRNIELELKVEKKSIIRKLLKPVAIGVIIATLIALALALLH